MGRNGAFGVAALIYALFPKRSLSDASAHCAGHLWVTGMLGGGMMDFVLIDHIKTSAISLTLTTTFRQQAKAEEHYLIHWKRPILTITYSITNDPECYFT